MAPRHRDADDPGLCDIYRSNVPNKGLGKYTYFLHKMCIIEKDRISSENLNKFVQNVN